mgnify:CR=1 FL=1
MLLTGSVVGLLHLKSIQTYIISKVTNKLSKEWQTDVHIEQFHYRPLSHLVVDSIYLSDQQKDTLAYIEQIDLRFDPLALGDMQLEIEQLIVKKPYINIQNRSVKISLFCLLTQFVTALSPCSFIIFSTSFWMNKLNIKKRSVSEPIRSVFVSIHPISSNLSDFQANDDTVHPYKSCTKQCAANDIRYPMHTGKNSADNHKCYKHNYRKQHALSEHATFYPRTCLHCRRGHQT